jgi:hypothetical protein
VVPPLVGVAVKVTDVPEQIAPEGTAAILTLAGRVGLTITVKDGDGGVGTHPAVAVNVKVAVPLYVPGGVHVGLLAFAFGEKDPPTPPSSQTAAVVPSKNTPPRPTVVPPWQIVLSGPTVTH